MMYRLVFLIIQFLNVLYIVSFWSRPSLFVDANRSAYYHHAFKPLSPNSLSSSLLFSSNFLKKLSRLMRSESDLNRNSPFSLTKLFDSVLKIKSSQSETSPLLKDITVKCSPKPRHHHHISKYYAQEHPVHVSYFAQNHLPLASSPLHPQSPSVQLSSQSTRSSLPYHYTNHRPTHFSKSKLTQRLLTSCNGDIKHCHSSFHGHHYSLPFPLDFKKPASTPTNLNQYLPPIILPIFKSLSLPKKENIPTFFEKQRVNLEKDYNFYVDKDWSNNADNEGSQIQDSYKVTSSDETINTEIPEIVTDGKDIEYQEEVFSKQNQAKLTKNAQVVRYSRSHLATNPSHISFGLAYSKPKPIPAQPASHYLNEKLLFPETATKSGHLMLEMAQHYSKLKEQNLEKEFTKLETSRNKPHPHHSEEELYISTKEGPYAEYSSKELKHSSPLLIKSKLPLPSNRPLYLKPDENEHLKSSTQSGYLMLEMTQHTVNDSQSKAYFLKENEFVDKQPKLDYLKTEIPHSSSLALYHSKLHSNQSKGELNTPKIELFQHSASNMSLKNISPKVHYSQLESNNLKSTSSNLVKDLSPRVVYADSESNDHEKERLNTESHSKFATEANYTKIKLTQHSPSTPHYSHPKPFQTQQEPSYSSLKINQDNLPKVSFDEPFYSKQREINTDQLYPSETFTQSGYLMLEMTQHLPSNNKPESESHQAKLDNFYKKLASNYKNLKTTHSPVTLIRDEPQLTYVQPKLSFSQSDSHSYDENKSFDSELSAVEKLDYSTLKVPQNTPTYTESKLGYSDTKQQLIMPKFETESEIGTYNESGTSSDYSKLAKIKIPASVPHFTEQILYKQLSKLDSSFDVAELLYLDDKKSSYPLFTDHKVVFDNQEAPFIKSKMLYSKPEVSSQNFDRSQGHYVHYNKEEEEEEEEEENDEREGEIEVEEDSDMLAEEY